MGYLSSCEVKTIHFSSNKYVMPTGKWKYICTWRRNAWKYTILTPYPRVNSKRMWFSDKLIYVQNNYFNTTVYNQQQFAVVKNLYITFWHHRWWPQFHSGFKQLQYPTYIDCMSMSQLTLKPHWKVRSFCRICCHSS